MAKTNGQGGWQVGSRWALTHQSAANRLPSYQTLRHWALGAMASGLWFAAIDDVTADEPAPLSTVTVTAQKVEEALESVPASVTVFTSDVLEDREIDSIADIANYTPNFISFDTGIVGLWVPSVRGIHEDGAGSNPIGLFVDGVPILTATGFNDELLDVERVEVLRGPQGALYGSNTQAGVINVISARPGDTFSAKATARVGEDNKRQLTATLKGPIAKDQLSYSLAASHVEKDGYIKNANSGDLVNDRKYNYAKASLWWTPSASVDVSLIGSVLAFDDGGQTIALSPDGAAAFGLDTPAPRTVASDLDGWNKSASNSQALKIDWHINDYVSLQSLTARREYKTRYLTDFDFSPFQVFHKEFDNSQAKLSNELKLSWVDAKKTLIGGVYYDDDDNQFRDIDDVTRQVDQDHRVTANTLGVFGYSAYALSDNINVSAGLRYDRKTSDYTDVQTGARIDDDWEEVSPRLALDYTVNDQAMVYASVSKGYRSGGFNEHAADGDPLTYEEETLISYEAEIKSDFYARRLRLGVAVYYMDIDDMHVRISSQERPEFNYTDNAASAWSSGLEAELDARLNRELTLSQPLATTTWSSVTTAMRMVTTPVTATPMRLSTPIA